MTEDFDLKSLFDDRIVPLLDQIHALCEEHKMPYLASFCHTSKGEDIVINTSGYFQNSRRIYAFEEAYRALQDE